MFEKFTWVAAIASSSALAAMLATPAMADGDSDLAKKLSNPVASLVSVPLKFDYNSSYGADEKGIGRTWTLQPVIPISLNEDWNVISRTLIPFQYNTDIPSGSGTVDGFGDITASFFFSPKEPTKNGVIWGVGPILQIPTGTDVSSKTWGAGVTGLVLKQKDGWTVGALASQLWDVSGDVPINATYLQPFLSYTNRTAWSYTLNTESTYNRVSGEWSVPINAMVSKLVRWGKQPISLQGGLRYCAETPESGPKGWGLRMQVTYLFPKK